jgi:PPP family 3-phenylpropionic acid transporter
MLAPTTTLSDALAVRRARDEHTSAVRFEYGWVRGAGSAAFIVGLLASGQVLDAFPPALSLAAQASILVIAAGTALLVPEIDTPLRRSVSGAGRALPDLRLLLSNRPFRRLVIIAALVLGSHAMHDGFATIAWHAAGISPSTTSVLWSESVAAEVLVFFLLGPLILRNMSPGAAMVISASAAMLRWLVMSQSSSVFALALLEPLHGFSFALLHLACMRVLARVTPGELAATAQAIYALAIAIVSALLTFVSGFVYAQFGLGGFIVMALIGAASLPVIIGGRHQLMLN